MFILCYQLGFLILAYVWNFMALCWKSNFLFGFFSSKWLDLVISVFYNWMTEVLQFGKLLGKDMLFYSKIACPLQSIDTEWECNNILFDHENICWNWHLSAFCTFSTFKMLTRYNVKQFKLINYVMSHTIILFQL